jgi:hypothetical protein
VPHIAKIAEFQCQRSVGWSSCSGLGRITWVRWPSSSTGAVGSSPVTTWVGSPAADWSEPALLPGRNTVVLSPSSPGPSACDGAAGPYGGVAGSAPAPGGVPNGDAAGDCPGGDEYG